MKTGKADTYRPAVRSSSRFLTPSRSGGLVVLTVVLALAVATVIAAERGPSSASAAWQAPSVAGSEPLAVGDSAWPGVDDPQGGVDAVAAGALVDSAARWDVSSARRWVDGDQFAVVAVDGQRDGAPVTGAAAVQRAATGQWRVIGTAPSHGSSATTEAKVSVTGGGRIGSMVLSLDDANPGEADGPEVGGDPHRGAIIAEGSVLLPGSFDGDAGVRQSASNCDGCLWKLELACGWDADSCQGATVGCAPDELRWWVMLMRPPATDYSVVGTVCRSAGDELLTVDAAAEQVRQRYIELLPRANPSVQPSERSLVNVPTLFAVNEPSAFGPVAMNVVGYAVEISGSVEWTWDFGDGERLVTDEPGGKYPTTSLSHTYRRAGERVVTVDSTWAGEFTINGEGPFPIAGGPITLATDVEVQVSEAAAVLVAP